MGKPITRRLTAGRLQKFVCVGHQLHREITTCQPKHRCKNCTGRTHTIRRITAGRLQKFVCVVHQLHREITTCQPKQPQTRGRVMHHKGLNPSLSKMEFVFWIWTGPNASGLTKFRRQPACLTSLDSSQMVLCSGSYTA